MLLFHVQNGLYNSFFFSDGGVKEILYYETEDDYNADKYTTRTLEYNGNVYDSTHKYFIFIGGHAIKVNGMEIMLMPNEESNVRGIGEILKDSIDVTEYTGTSNRILIPYTDRLSHTYEIYDESGNKIQVYSSDSGFPFIGNDNAAITTPTSGFLKDKKCVYLTWSGNTFIKSNTSFSDSSNALPWAFLSSLKPLYIIVKPRKPKLESGLFNNFIFDYDNEIYNKSYYIRW